MLNVVETLARRLRGRPMVCEENQLLYRLKDANETNSRLETRIIELSGGKSVTEILSTITEGLDQVWASWHRTRIQETIQKLEAKGFIRVERRTNDQAHAIDTHSGADVHP